MIDLPEVQLWIKEAGNIALNHFRSVVPYRKADKSVVTDADYAVQDFLIKQIKEKYPDHSIIAEEKFDHSGSEILWAIDPIDGTIAFALGLPTWCISIGILKNYCPLAGIIYSPLTKELFMIDETRIPTYNGVRLNNQVEKDIDEKSVLFVGKRAFHDYDIVFPGDILSCGSGILEICMVARGMAIGALSFEASIWDLAAIHPILNAVGVEMRYLNGDLVTLDKLRGRGDPPILSCHPNMAKRLFDMITQKNTL